MRKLGSWLLKIVMYVAIFEAIKCPAILVHEVGHCLVARAVGWKVEEITLGDDGKLLASWNVAGLKLNLRRDLFFLGGGVSLGSKLDRSVAKEIAVNSAGALSAAALMLPACLIFFGRKRFREVLGLCALGATLPFSLAFLFGRRQIRQICDLRGNPLFARPGDRPDDDGGGERCAAVKAADFCLLFVAVNNAVALAPIWPGFDGFSTLVELRGLAAGHVGRWPVDCLLAAPFVAALALWFIKLSLKRRVLAAAKNSG